MSVKCNKGFSLVEMLISVTILMLVLGLAMYAYQLYNRQWQKELSRADAAFLQYKYMDLFNSAMIGITPYAVKKQRQFGFYFLGRTNGFTAITKNPLVESNAAAVIRVFKEQMPNGKIQLVYEEASLAHMTLVNAEQELPFSRRMVLLEQLKSLEFEYQQHSTTVNEDVPEANIEKFEWVNALDGLTTETHPSRIRLIIDGAVWEFRIVDREKTLRNRAFINNEDAV